MEAIHEATQQEESILFTLRSVWILIYSGDKEVRITSTNHGESNGEILAGLINNEVEVLKVALRKTFLHRDAIGETNETVLQSSSDCECRGLGATRSVDTNDEPARTE